MVLCSNVSAWTSSFFVVAVGLRTTWVSCGSSRLPWRWRTVKSCLSLSLTISSRTNTASDSSSLPKWVTWLADDNYSIPQSQATDMNNAFSTKSRSLTFTCLVFDLYVFCVVEFAAQRDAAVYGGCRPTVDGIELHWHTSLWTGMLPHKCMRHSALLVAVGT